MPWIVSFHIIAMVAWFAGLFYLPRLFVYHAASHDVISLERFKVMEHKLYYYIMMPAAFLTTLFGFWLLALNWKAYQHAMYMHVKLSCVLLLWVYHLYCGFLVKRFRDGKNHYSQKFYRFYNEIPTLLLIVIVICAVVKPF